MPIQITPRQRSLLKARAHALEPFVRVGNARITDAVVAEVDRALTAHGLIKVRLGGATREDREAQSAELSARSDATVVQSVGKVVVLWRPRADDQVPTT